MIILLDFDCIEALLEDYFIKRLLYYLSSRLFTSEDAAFFFLFGHTNIGNRALGKLS